MYPYIIHGNAITIIVDGQTHMFNEHHYQYKAIMDAVKASNWEKVKTITDPSNTVMDEAYPHVTISGSQVKWHGEPLHSSIGNRIIWMLGEGFDLKPMVAFIDNLKRNPSKTAVEELYLFLEQNTLPITEDGHFIAYKMVKDDYTDVYTGTVLNKPAAAWTEEEKATLTKKPLSCGKDDSVYIHVRRGNVIHSMRRNRVDDNRHNTCSDGLHFCSAGYLGKYSGERIVILKINPKNVVSIPPDYNNSKGRCCEYQVIDEINKTIDDTHSFGKIVI